jgi:hypothetical protein
MKRENKDQKEKEKKKKEKEKKKPCCTSLFDFVLLLVT